MNTSGRKTTLNRPAAGKRRLLRAALAATLLASLLLAAGWGYNRLLAHLLGENDASGEPTPPRIVLRDTRRDFGSVEAGRVLRAGLLVENQGGRRLILTRQANACGCLAGEAELLIAPGQRRRVTVRLETRTFRGPIAVPVRYQTNDPQHPLIEFQLWADVGHAEDGQDSAAERNSEAEEEAGVQAHQAAVVQ